MPRQPAQPPSAPAPDQHPAYPITARYPGTCHNCGEPIPQGSPIHWAPTPKLATHRAPDPYNCGPPIIADPAPKPRFERPDNSPAFEWVMGKSD